MRQASETLRPVEYPAQPLAEDMVPSCATTALHHFLTHRSPAGQFHSAWRHVEFGTNQQIHLSDDVREVYFDDARHLTGRVIESDTSDEDLRLAALTLDSYLPLFAKRARREAIEPADCRQIYDSLGSAIQYLQPVCADAPPRWRMTETAVLAASARIGRPDLLLYPTSPREEASRIAAENHDSYFLKGSMKLPLQQKLQPTDKRYNRHITLLVLLPLMDHGYRKCQIEAPKTPSDKLNHLLSLITAETNQIELYEDEQQFLNYMSRAVAAHYHEAIERQVAA